MAKPKAILAPYIDKFDAMPKRERMMAFSIAMLVILLGSVQFLIDPILIKNKTISDEIATLKEELQERETAFKIRKIEYRIDPNKPLRKEKEALIQELNLIDKELEALTFSLIPPQKMIKVIRDLISSQDNIRLESMSSLEPRTVFFIKNKTEKADDDQFTSEELENLTEQHQAQKLYRHGINLTITGDFFSILNYLRKIESLKWRLSWHEIDYQVNNYPEASVFIEIHTFSQNVQVIGV